MHFFKMISFYYSVSIVCALFFEIVINVTVCVFVCVSVGDNPQCSRQCSAPHIAEV